MIWLVCAAAPVGVVTLKEAISIFLSEVEDLSIPSESKDLESIDVTDQGSSSLNVYNNPMGPYG